jgi:amino-acid N-acetyltransferase
MKIEKAKISDALKIHELVNKFAERGEMLPRALSDIYQNLRDYFVLKDGENLLACAALHINWGDMAEIRSMAVSETSQLKGLGAMLVKAGIEEAKTLDMPTVFCLTYKPAFFEKQGFHIVDKSELPRKVWAECFHCPKFPDCDETALLLRLKTEKSPLKIQSVRTVSSQQIYDGRAIKLRVDTVITPSGRKTTREIVEHADCIVAVPLDRDNNVLMVRQHREAVGKNLLELPAGGIDDGEQPVDTVRRELQEEIGYLPQKIEKIGGFYPSPGYTTEYLHLYLATDLEPKKLFAEDTDEIDIVKVPLSQITDMIAKGEICDAKSIIGLNAVLTLKSDGKA